MTGLYRFLSKYYNKKNSGYLPEKKMREKKTREKMRERKKKTEEERKLRNTGKKQTYTHRNGHRHRQIETAENLRKR